MMCFIKTDVFNVLEVFIVLDVLMYHGKRDLLIKNYEDFILNLNLNAQKSFSERKKKSMKSNSGLIRIF